MNDCLAWSGQRPVAWLYDHLPVDQRWCLVHATHLDRDELEALARSRAVAGLCLTTEANLGDGIFPGDAYLQRQGRWGIGSDSHVSLNVVEELRWFEYGQRLRDQRRNRLTTPEQSAVGDVLYLQALQGGAQACGAPIGRLQSGYRADWLVLDGDDPYLAAAPDVSILNRWLFAGGKANSRRVRRRPAGDRAGAARAAAAEQRRVPAGVENLSAGGVMSLTRFSFAALPVSPWRNGGGETREIVSWPRARRILTGAPASLPSRRTGRFPPLRASTARSLCWKATACGCSAPGISTINWLASGNRSRSPATWRWKRRCWAAPVRISTS